MGNGRNDRIDRSKLKDPEDVSGWGEGGGQDFSDIARDTGRNAEFVPPHGHPAEISPGTSPATPAEKEGEQRRGDR